MPSAPDPGRVESSDGQLSARIPGQPIPPGALAIRRGILHRPPGDGQQPSDALLTRVLAVARTSRIPRVFSHHSAAAICGLPIIGRWPTKVEYVSHPEDKGRSPGVRRRRTELRTDPVECAGLLVTSVARTVIDLAREITLVGALAAADHALHHGWCTSDDLRREAAAIPCGHRGRRRAVLVSQLADGKSESVGESLSRARMFELRIPRPRLQVVRTPEGDRVDYFWPHAQLSGEFDGKVKYGLLSVQSAQDAADELFREKRREDRIRAVGDAIGRWVWDEAYDIGRFEWVMRRLGLEPGAGIMDWPSPTAPDSPPSGPEKH